MAESPIIDRTLYPFASHYFDIGRGIKLHLPRRRHRTAARHAARQPDLVVHVSRTRDGISRSLSLHRSGSRRLRAFRQARLGAIRLFTRAPRRGSHGAARPFATRPRCDARSARLGRHDRLGMGCSIPRSRQTADRAEYSRVSDARRRATSALALVGAKHVRGIGAHSRGQCVLPACGPVGCDKAVATRGSTHVPCALRFVAQSHRGAEVRADDPPLRARCGLRHRVRHRQAAAFDSATSLRSFAGECAISYSTSTSWRNGNGDSRLRKSIASRTPVITCSKTPATKLPLESSSISAARLDVPDHVVPPILVGASAVSRSRYREPQSQKKPASRIGAARKNIPSRRLDRSSIQPTIGGEMTSPTR